MNFSKDPYIKVKDYSVSGETFELLYDEELQLLKTYPQPSLDKLATYYESQDYISHTDSKRTWFEKLYHFIRRRAIRQKVNLIDYCNGEKGKVLDIGCGTGDFLAEAHVSHWKTFGIEPNEKAASLTRAKGLCLAKSTMEFEDNFFDVVTMWHVLEHVPNLEEQIEELKRIIKPTGTIIVAVPNFKSFDAKYYGKYWAAYDVPRHLWHFSKTAIQKLFEVSHLKVSKVQPMYFDSFYVSLLSEKNKSGKMNVIKGLFLGLKSNIYAKKKSEYSSHIYIIKNN